MEQITKDENTTLGMLNPSPQLLNKIKMTKRMTEDDIEDDITKAINLQLHR